MSVCYRMLALVSDVQIMVHSLMSLINAYSRGVKDMQLLNCFTLALRIGSLGLHIVSL